MVAARKGVEGVKRISVWWRTAARGGGKNFSIMAASRYAEASVVGYRGHADMIWNAGVSGSVAYAGGMG